MGCLSRFLLGSLSIEFLYWGRFQGAGLVFLLLCTSAFLMLACVLLPQDSSPPRSSSSGDGHRPLARRGKGGPQPIQKHY